MTTKAAESPAETRDDSVWFITDQRGRTLFYPNGLSWGGYVVTETQRAEALRDATKRYDDGVNRQNGLAAALTAPFLIGFYSLLYSHPFLAFALLFTGPLLTLGLVNWIARLSLFGRLLHGLERVPSADPVSRRLWLGAVLFLVLMVAVPWLVLHLYDSRISALPHGRDTIEFYPDISLWIVLSMGICPLTLVALLKWNKMSERLGTTRHLLSVAVLTVLALGSVWSFASDFFDPTPEIVLTPNSLFCEQPANWSAISGILLEDGARGREYARIELDRTQTQWLSSPTKRTSIKCEITSKNVDYATIYAAIQNHWATYAAAQDNSPSETVAARVAIGASKKEVMGTLGSPIVVRSDTGDIYYYPSSSLKHFRSLADTANDWHLIVVNFDKSGHAQHVADYHRQGKDFVDLAGGPPLGFADTIVVDTLLRAVSQKRN